MPDSLRRCCEYDFALFEFFTLCFENSGYRNPNEEGKVLNEQPVAGIPTVLIPDRFRDRFDA